ncbi:MAG TPA: NAD(P)-dependent oxidoreductase [Pyrinomonadaceae bacterium]|nr:NAD(P)-dependent oxidoreductase [Pyrinomonadaceae bacterium]
MITILGASGFIGSHLADKLGQLHFDVHAIRRGEPIPQRNLGDVIYCIGVTADFRSRTFATVESHVCALLDVARTCNFESLLYLSSTRLYAGNDSTAEEQPLRVRPHNPDDLYNISKAMGESIALNCGRPARVARIANVYGPDFTSANFLPSILKQAASGETIVLQTAPESAKDYISVADVVDGLIQIATKGQQQIYNLASGVNVSHREIAETLQRSTGCAVEFATAAPEIKSPPINIDRMRSEFNFAAASILDDLPQLVQLYRANRSHT